MGDDTLPVQRLGFGCVKLGSASGGRTWRSDVRLVRAAIEAGVNLFDTADAYGRGVSERILGKAVRGRREDVEIATKIGYRFDDRSLLLQSTLKRAAPIARAIRTSGPVGDGATRTSRSGYASQDFSPARLTSAIDASLRRLDTDYIDVVQLHGPPAHMPDVLGCLGDFVRTGKVRRWGVGAESVESACAWIGTEGVGVVQLPFGVLDPEAADHAFAGAASSGTEIWVRGVFGGGVLADAAAGRINSASTAEGPPGSHSHVKWPLIKALLELADSMNMSPFELALGYVRSFSSVSSIIVGVHSVEHLELNIQMLQRPPLGADVVRQIEQVGSAWKDSDAHRSGCP